MKDPALIEIAGPLAPFANGFAGRLELWGYARQVAGRAPAPDGRPERLVGRTRVGQLGVEPRDRGGIRRGSTVRAVPHSKHPIAAELLRHTDTADPVFGSSRDRVLAAGRPLLAAAQQAHQVRADLGLDQVLDLVLAAATIRGEPDYVEPILQAALDGLRG